MFEGEEGKKRPRDRRKVRYQVAEQVAGFASAEGGVLTVGIEDNHRVTGRRLLLDLAAAVKGLGPRPGQGRLRDAAASHNDEKSPP